jgi:hypothetical protein
VALQRETAMQSIFFPPWRMTPMRDVLQTPSESAKSRELVFHSMAERRWCYK